jgi:hypothetical protein
MSSLEINSTDASATLADKQRARTVMSSETSATPTQRDDLSISAVVIGLDILQRDNKAFYKRISKGCFEIMHLVPAILVGEYLPAA